MMNAYDLCVAWNVPEDADFVQVLAQACQERGLSLLEVTPSNLDATYWAINSGEITCRALLNRAADTDPRFLFLLQWAKDQGILLINPQELEERSADKATMHLEFIAAGLDTPHTIILSPVWEQPALPAVDLTPLGPSFAIKPATGGGGRGVVMEATSIDQVLSSRQQYPGDKYLLQAHVTPVMLEQRPAWFRVVYCSGKSYPCWWPPQTRLYVPITAEEEERFGLEPLRAMADQIARVSQLHMFSTEIALADTGKFLAVDYVNDQIDLRLQSRVVDGVPDMIVQDIAARRVRPSPRNQAGASQTSLPSHDQMDPQATWNAPSVFESPAAWEAEWAAVVESLPAMRHFKGHLATGPATLANAMDSTQTLMRRVSRLLVYANMSQAVDTADQVAAERLSRARSLYGQMAAAISFVDPEILAIGRDTITRWVQDEPRLAYLKHYVDDLFRKQAHVRSAEVEEVLGMLSDPFSGSATTWSMLTNADFQFEPAVDREGRELPLAQGTLQKILATPDREARRTAWENYADQYLAFKNTLASTLQTSIKQFVLAMRARGYPSSLEMSLFRYNIPVAVYHNLLDAFRQNLPTWHRYWTIRRRALAVKPLQPYDVWAPLTSQPQAVPYNQAVDWLSAALAPMGQEYVNAMRRGALEERWVDVYPNRGKASGAFSSGSPGTFPFIMMSYNDDVFSMSTLAHELGHSMHSLLAWQSQPVLYARYSLFAAEVASNFHQAMLRAHLLRQELPRDLQIAVIEEAMSNFHRYFLIMPTLARFELETHQRVERGQGLTADSLIDLLADLLAEAYGPEMAIDPERVGIQWATYGHMYSDYYVYQYATGISGAHALSNRILAGTPGAVADYLRFLRAGASLYPIDALRLAGVDLATLLPVQETFAVLGDLVDRLEGLVATEDKRALPREIGGKR